MLEQLVGDEFKLLTWNIEAGRVLWLGWCRTLSGPRQELSEGGDLHPRVDEELRVTYRFN